MIGGGNYRIAAEELLPRNLKATFNITTGYINGNINEKDAPCENPPLTVDDVRELGKYEEFEIAGHGHEHLNTLEDWKKGIDVLTDWLGSECALFGYYGSCDRGLSERHSGHRLFFVRP